MFGPGGRTSRWRRLGCAGAITASIGLWPSVAAAAPAPPVVTADPATSTPPHLSWAPVAGADGYQVDRVDGCPRPPGDPLSSEPVGNPWFDDLFIDLQRAAHLFYTVESHDSTGLSAPSNCVAVDYDPDPPRLALDATAQPDGSIALTWRVSDFSKHVGLVLRRSNAGGAPPSSEDQGNPVCATPENSTGCTDTAVVSGSRYAYTLFGVDEAGNRSASRFSVQSQDLVPPSAPAGVAALASDGGVSITWLPPAETDVAGYRVVYRTGTVAPVSVTDGVAACEVAAPQTSCSFGGLANGAPVSVTVFARDEAANWSAPAPTSSVTATPVAPPVAAQPPAPAPLPPPAVADHQPPGRLTAVKVRLSASGVALTWKNPSAPDLDHVVITRNAHHRPHGPGDGRRTVLGKATHALIAAERGERFHLSLYAYDHAGNVSQAASVDVSIPKVLPAPGTAVSRGRPKLSWESVAKAAYYNVVVTREGKRVAIGWPTSTSWTPPKLKPGRYRWYVWPGFGSKAAARYGHLIGTSSFIIR